MCVNGSRSLACLLAYACVYWRYHAIVCVQQLIVRYISESYKQILECVSVCVLTCEWDHLRLWVCAYFVYVLRYLTDITWNSNTYWRNVRCMHFPLGNRSKLTDFFSFDSFIGCLDKFVFISSLVQWKCNSIEICTVYSLCSCFGVIYLVTISFKIFLHGARKLKKTEAALWNILLVNCVCFPLWFWGEF